jgi:carbonic anhydrase
MTFPHRLLSGYRAFIEGRLGEEQARFQQLAEEGQHPEIMVIGCCDSRVAPETIFDAHPGELFVVRNVANLVPPYTPDANHRAVSAALEFAVQALLVKHIVVLGHARCGGVRAFAENAAPLSGSDFIGRWVELIRPAAAALGPRSQYATPQDYLAALEHRSVLAAIDNLMTFPYVRMRAERGELGVHGAFFDVSTGLLSVYDPETRTFASAAGAGHTRNFSQPRF